MATIMHKQHIFDSRFLSLESWSNDIVDLLASESPNFHLDSQFCDWEPIEGDASSRRYFRANFGLHSYIFMDCPPPDNISAFVDVNNRMKIAGIRVPTIYAFDKIQGFILLEDLGPSMLKDIIDKNTGNEIFDQLLPILFKMINEVNTDGLPLYDENILNNEMNLFIDWFGKRFLDYQLTNKQDHEWERFKLLIIQNAINQPQSFTHRDFHSCNLLKLKDDTIGVIDFQDAMIGPISYDTVSWLWDRYITWPRDDIEKLLVKAGRCLAPNLEKEQWIKHCDLIAIQRNLKIIGIFFKLSFEDEKHHYVSLVPRFIDYTLFLLEKYMKELGNASIWISSWLAEGIHKLESKL